MAITSKHITKINIKSTRKKAANIQFTASIDYDEDSRLYVGFVPNLPGAHTQGATLDELHKNLKEVIELSLEETQ